MSLFWQKGRSVSLKLDVYNGSILVIVLILCVIIFLLCSNRLCLLAASEGIF